MIVAADTDQCIDVIIFLLSINLPTQIVLHCSQIHGPFDDIEIIGDIQLHGVYWGGENISIIRIDQVTNHRLETGLHHRRGEGYILLASQITGVCLDLPYNKYIHTVRNKHTTLEHNLHDLE